MNKTSRSVIKEANSILMPASMVNNVKAILANPIIEPIDKSNSPLIISRATPIERMPISEDTCK